MGNVLDSYKYCRLLYVKKGMTPEEIAGKLGVSHMTVYRALRKHNLLRK